MLKRCKDLGCPSKSLVFPVLGRSSSATKVPLLANAAWIVVHSASMLPMLRIRPRILQSIQARITLGTCTAPQGPNLIVHMAPQPQVSYTVYLHPDLLPLRLDMTMTKLLDGAKPLTTVPHSAVPTPDRSRIIRAVFPATLWENTAPVQLSNTIASPYSRLHPLHRARMPLS